MSSDLRKRSIKAGAIQGFFGQKNRNTKRKNDMADRVAELREQQELERSKTQYEASVARTTKRRESEASIVAANGVDAEGNINEQGWQIAASQNVSGWNQMSSQFKENYIRSASGGGPVNASTYYDNLYGPVASTSAFSDQMGGKSPFPTVQKTKNAMSRQVEQINGGPQALTSAELAAQRKKYEVGSYETKNEVTDVHTGTDAKTGEEVLTRIYEDGTTNVISLGTVDPSVLTTTEVDSKDGVIIMTTNKTTGVKLAKTEAMAEVNEWQQATDTYVDDEGEPVIAYFSNRADAEGEAGVFFINRETGNRSYNLHKEAESDAAARTATGTERAEKKMVFSNSMAGFNQVESLMSGRNAANQGVQGLVNNAMASLGHFLNPMQSLEDGKVLSANVELAISMPEKVRKAPPAERIAYAKKHYQKAMGEEMFNMLASDLNFALDSEQTKEWRQLAMSASQNAKMVSLVYFAAKSFRGKGKLNESDLARIGDMIKLNQDEAQFQGSAKELQRILYNRGKENLGSLINMATETSTRPGDRIRTATYFRDSKGNQPSGFLVQIRSPKSGEPNFVFVNGSTGGVQEFHSKEEHQDWAVGMVKVPAPLGIGEGY